MAQGQERGVRRSHWVRCVAVATTGAHLGQQTLDSYRRVYLIHAVHELPPAPIKWMPVCGIESSNSCPLSARARCRSHKVLLSRCFHYCRQSDKTNSGLSGVMRAAPPVVECFSNECGP